MKTNKGDKMRKGGIIGIVGENRTIFEITGGK